MQAFKDIYLKLDRTQSTNEKVEILVDFFLNTHPEEAAWALFFLTGNRLKRTISSHDLRKWCYERIDLPEWLFEECYSAVGDTGEMIALLLNSKQNESFFLWELMEKHIIPIKDKAEEDKKQMVFSFWNRLDRDSCFLFNKILTGSFRVGTSTQLTLKALSLALDVPREKLAQAISTVQDPTREFFLNLKNLKHQSVTGAQPFPFFLASPLDKPLEELGSPSEWLAEWKWDGIRAELIINEKNVTVWSRGNEMISEQCPELVEECEKYMIQATLDGEILAFQNDKPLPFFALQKRLGRKKPSKKIREEVPLVFMAYDLLSSNGEDHRPLSLLDRRTKLMQLLNEWHSPRILLSPEIPYESWDKMRLLWDASKDNNVEGLMLKRLSSSYRSGRIKGDWWKFKVEPLTIDAVLIYAQPGSGRRSNLYTDYTFGVWDGEQLVPIAKAYSGLDQKEIDELDKWIRRHTQEKFGPVRHVVAFHVFELAFENAQPSNRHKAGIALRFPRIKRWRRDKTPDQADKLPEIKKNLFPHGY